MHVHLCGDLRGRASLLPWLSVRLWPAISQIPWAGIIDERQVASITRYLLTDWHWRIIGAAAATTPHFTRALWMECRQGRRTLLAGHGGDGAAGRRGGERVGGRRSSSLPAKTIFLLNPNQWHKVDECAQYGWFIFLWTHKDYSTFIDTHQTLTLNTP